MLADDQARERIARLEELLEDLQRLDGPAREAALEAVAALAAVYGEALRRMLAEMAPAAAQRMARDELVGHLLLVHDLHPLSVEQRVRAALDELRDNGGAAELVAIESGTARVRLGERGNGCGPALGDVESAVEGAILAVAPELTSVLIDDGSGTVGLPMAQNGGVR